MATIILLTEAELRRHVTLDSDAIDCVEQALEALQLSLSIDGDYARAHRLRGLKLLQGGREAQGLGHLERAAQLLPADDTLRAELAAARSVAKQRKAP